MWWLEVLLKNRSGWNLTISQSFVSEKRYQNDDFNDGLNQVLDKYKVSVEIVLDKKTLYKTKSWHSSEPQIQLLRYKKSQK